GLLAPRCLRPVSTPSRSRPSPPASSIRLVWHRDRPIRGSTMLPCGCRVCRCYPSGPNPSTAWCILSVLGRGAPEWDQDGLGDEDGEEWSMASGRTSGLSGV